LSAKERHDSQPRPFDRALSFFDPLLRRAAVVVEGHDALRRPRQMGNDEAVARIKLPRVPFDLGHHPPGPPWPLRSIRDKIAEHHTKTEASALKITTSSGECVIKTRLRLSHQRVHLTSYWIQAARREKTGGIA
jgi:hypothetical protein